MWKLETKKKTRRYPFTRHWSSCLFLHPVDPAAPISYRRSRTITTLTLLKWRKKKKKVKPGCFNCLYSQVGCKRCYRNRYESAEPLAQEKRFSRETSAVLTRTRWASPLAAVCMLFIKQQQRQTLHLPSPHELCICFHVVADPTRSNLNEPSSLLFFFFPTQMPPCLHTSLVHSQ